MEELDKQGLDRTNSGWGVTCAKVLWADQCWALQREGLDLDVTLQSRR